MLLVFISKTTLERYQFQKYEKQFTYKNFLCLIVIKRLIFNFFLVFTTAYKIYMYFVDALLFIIIMFSIKI